jgi:hypothetical protein
VRRLRPAASSLALAFAAAAGRGRWLVDVRIVFSRELERQDSAVLHVEGIAVAEKPMGHQSLPVTASSGELARH